MTDFEVNAPISGASSMADFTEMPRVAKAYWLLVIGGGLQLSGAITVRVAAAGQGESLLKLAIYVVAAGGCSRPISRSGCPASWGRFLMNYVVVIVALQDLDLGSAVIVGTASTLVRCLIHASERPKWFQVLFSVAGIPCPVMAAQAALKSRGLLLVDHTGYIALLVASMAYYVINTVTVAEALSAASTGKPVYIGKRGPELISLDLPSLPCGRRDRRRDPLSRYSLGMARAAYGSSAALSGVSLLQPLSGKGGRATEAYSRNVGAPPAHNRDPGPCHRRQRRYNRGASAAGTGVCHRDRQRAESDGPGNESAGRGGAAARRL